MNEESRMMKETQGIYDELKTLEAELDRIKTKLNETTHEKEEYRKKFEQVFSLVQVFKPDIEPNTKQQG